VTSEEEGYCGPRCIDKIDSSQMHSFCSGFQNTIWSPSNPPNSKSRCLLHSFRSRKILHFWFYFAFEWGRFHSSQGLFYRTLPNRSMMIIEFVWIWGVKNSENYKELWEVWDIESFFNIDYFFVYCVIGIYLLLCIKCTNSIITTLLFYF